MPHWYSQSFRKVYFHVALVAEQGPLPPPESRRLWAAVARHRGNTSAPGMRRLHAYHPNWKVAPDWP